MTKYKYEHDTERWLRGQAKIYALRQNLGMAATFERCADDYAALRLRAEQAEAMVKSLEEALREIANLYWKDAPFPQEMRDIARKALEDK